MPILIFLFIALPIAELFVILQVGQAIGALPTVGLMLLTAIVGGALARSQGRNTWRRFNEAMTAGKVPGGEVLDGAMIIFGGALLLTPGFITDVLGITLLAPPTRSGYKRLLRGVARRTKPGRPILFVYERHRRSPGRGERAAPRGAGAPPPPPHPPSGAGGARPRRDYDVEGTAREVGDDEPELGAGREER
jgi:UPF0716 protein FxsA